MMNASRKLAFVTLALFFMSASFAEPAFALLAGFESDDGYAPFLNDVATYNAGQYGVNAGGGTYINIPDNTGLWTKLQGPLVPATGTTGNFAYATGHQNYDRTNPSTSDQALIITTNTDGWSAGTQKYSYMIDSYDLDGVNPLSTTGQVINLSFWSCSYIVGTGEPGGGLGPGTFGHIVSFYDSSGNLGFSVGYEQPGTTTDYAATNVGSWVTSGVSVGTNYYHRWDITLDLAAQTVSIGINESSVQTQLVTNAPLINTMNDLAELQFESTPGISNYKVWALDDFDFQVPEPASMTLLGMALVGTVLSTRRRKE